MSLRVDGHGQPAPHQLADPPDTPLPDGVAQDDRDADALFKEARRRRRRRQIWSAAVLCAALVAGLVSYEVSKGTNVPVHRLALRVPVLAREPAASFEAACQGVSGGDLTALTATGKVVLLDAATGVMVGTLSIGADPAGGLALDQLTRRVYVTGQGADGQPAVWSLGCRGHSSVVAADAELPTVSPDGRHLAYVTLTRTGRQTGVGVVSLGTRGRRKGPVHHLTASTGPTPIPITSTVPSPIAIRGLALSWDASSLAVWGGFVDANLGRHTATTGDMELRDARSLSGLKPVITMAGVSGGGPLGESGGGDLGSFTAGGKRRQMTPPKPKGDRAAVYLPDGYLVLSTGDAGFAMPFTDRTPGLQGGGYRDIATSSAPVDAVAVGPAGAVASVTVRGDLSLVTAAWNLPLGPSEGFPYSPTPPRTLPGHYRAVAWTAGRGPAVTSLPPIYHMGPVPTVVGMPEPQAVSYLDGLAIPNFVDEVVTDLAVAPDTVLSESPGAGTQMACQCSVGLAVSAGGTPVTGSAPPNASKRATTYSKRSVG